MVNALAIVYQVLLGALVAVLTLVWWDRRKSHRLPPGPPRALFGDHRKLLAGAPPWVRYAAWTKQYGPVISLWTGRTPTIVLGTAQAAWDLLEKRGDIYSSRPRAIVANEIYSRGMRGISMLYGPEWRRWRKLLHTGLSGRAALAYRPLQSLESKVLLCDLIHSPPENAAEHLERFAASVIISLTYGRRVKTLNDPIIQENREVATYLQTINMPGRFIVDTYPILLWLPKSLQWFRIGPEARLAADTALFTRYLSEVQSKIESGKARESLAKYALDLDQTKDMGEGEGTGMSEVQVAFALSAPFIAGVDTTLSVLRVFLIAILHNPAAAERAQVELSTVVGPNRLPEFDDEPSLPYVRALIKEVMRWRAITPVAVPHAVITDDEYKGFKIPKGSSIIGNLAGITRDPALFPDPETFRPERFLDTQEPRLVEFDLPFGFGRRICPGMHVASQSLFIVIARILWAFDVKPTSGSDGVPLLPDPNKFVPSLVLQPAPFTCVFKPRSEEILRAIVREKAEADKMLLGWD